MLKINKILSKKIKTPLSLRGLFPFCHSHESGNPSHLSLRGEKRRSNLSGFSLIELMVAAAILAIALLGIFQAYSVGFMGMADARDRTVATNYLRETIEDFKNMNFSKVKDEPITLIPGTKFHRGSIVLDLEKKGEVVTLKKVITQVRWMDRKGNIKTEEASTILYNKPNTSEVSGAAGIILYAQPYYTILPNMTVTLTAEIKDNNGNTITDWEGNITFSVITDPPNDPPVGNITTPQPVPATNGVATCIFLAISGESIEGIEKIQASANLTEVGEVTDTVNIRVTTGAVGIILEPDVGHEILPVGDIATINVTVVKADYTTPIVYSGNITLSTEGFGTLSTTTINEVPSTGATVTLTSTGTPGIVEITASAPDLDMGYTEVTFTGEPESILVSSEKNSIYPGEETTITVTIVDINNTPVGFNEIVTLNVPSDYGIFDDNSNSIVLNFTGENSLTSIFKASLASPLGNVTISASGGGLTGSTNIEILNPLIPHHIGLFAFPLSIDVYGEETSTITATIYDDSNKKITNYVNTITFIAEDDSGSDFGTFSENNIIPGGGEATVELSSSSIGVATITVSSTDNLPLVPDGGITVVFYGSADHIVLSANPLSVQANGIDSSIIKAKVVDEGGNIVTNYNSVNTIIFIAKDDSDNDFGNFSENNIIPDEGVATVELSSDEIGTAIINANSSDSLLSDDGSVSIDFTGVITTELTLGEVINWNDYNISFGITITGSSLNLYEMQIVWNNDNATLDEIKINSPYPGDIDPKTIDTNISSSPCIVSSISKELIIGESDIRLTFSGSKMKNKNITVTFINEILESFEVTFIVPN